MKYFLIACLCFITSCSEKTELNPEPFTENSSETLTTITSSNNEDTFQYVIEIGIAQLLERKLKGYHLKAAIVNSFGPVLFYYNKDLQQVYFYLHESLTYRKKDSFSIKVNGQTDIHKILFFFTEEKENSELITVKFADMTEAEREKFTPPGLRLGYGFNLKPTDTLDFSITLAGGQQGLEQHVKVTYDPNNGWRSSASEITAEYEQLVANVFLFGKENIVKQIKRISKNEKFCVVRTRPHPYNYNALKLKIDNTYEAYNEHSIEIEVKNKQVIVNGNEGMLHIRSAIEDKEKSSNFHDPPKTRITISDSSDDDTVRELFDYIINGPMQAHYSIGIK
jgi:hypothetical protein